MMIALKKIKKGICLFLIGGSIYIIIEILWRSLRESTPTHWTMFLLGGIAFVLIGEINELLSWSIPFLIQCFIGTIVILVLEFIFGCYLNLYCQLNIRRYLAMI